MARRQDTFTMNPVTLFALLGAVVTFVVVGAVDEVLWVLIGGAVGAGLGFGIRRFSRRANTYAEAADLRETASRDELYEEAQKLEIPGRSRMTRDELAAAVAARHEH